MQGKHQPVCVMTMGPGTLKKLARGDCVDAKLIPEASRLLASQRAKVYHVFRDIKIRFGYAKNRYRGLAKNTTRLTFLMAISNVIRADAYERWSLIPSII